MPECIFRRIFCTVLNFAIVEQLHICLHFCSIIFVALFQLLCPESYKKLALYGSYTYLLGEYQIVVLDYSAEYE